MNGRTLCFFTSTRFGLPASGDLWQCLGTDSVATVGCYWYLRGRDQRCCSTPPECTGTPQIPQPRISQPPVPIALKSRSLELQLQENDTQTYKLHTGVSIYRDKQNWEMSDDYEDGHKPKRQLGLFPILEEWFCLLYTSDAADEVY